MNAAPLFVCAFADAIATATTAAVLCFRSFRYRYQCACVLCIHEVRHARSTLIFSSHSPRVDLSVSVTEQKIECIDVCLCDYLCVCVVVHAVAITFLPHLLIALNLTFEPIF